MPDFMLRQMLDNTTDAPMTIINFNLVPGGIARGIHSVSTDHNDRLSDILLESMELLLNASAMRLTLQTSEELSIKDDSKEQHTLEETRALTHCIEELRASQKIRMGGVFPQLIAQKGHRLQ